MKNIIERNLKFTSRYTVLSIIISGMNSDWYCCDNCNRQIANKATVQNTAGEKFVIGLDCLKTLTQAGVLDKSSFLESQDDIANALLVANLVGFAGKGGTVEKDLMYVTVTNGDKTKQCFGHLVQQYAPSFYRQIP